MAEGVGFEPTRACALPVFKTGAINRSTTPPDHLLGFGENRATAVAVSKVDRALRRSMMGTSAAAAFHQSPAERPIHLVLDNDICSCELGRCRNGKASSSRSLRKLPRPLLRST